MNNYFFRPPILRSAEVTLTPDAAGVVASSTLQTNTWYTVDPGTYDLSAITLTAADGMKYCGLDFETGTTAPSITCPATWIWVGAGCSGGDFTPSASKNYRVAIEQYGTTYVCTVQEIPEVAA